MLARGGVAYTNAAGKGEKGGQIREDFGRDYPKKPTELFFERDFRERFRVPNDISICLMDSGPMPTKKESFSAITFNKEQFNVGLRFPLPSLFKQFLHFTKIPHFFFHSNSVRVWV